MLPPALLRYRRFIVVLLHLVLIPLGYGLAYALRFDLDVPPHFRSLFWDTVAIVVAIRCAAFWATGLFRGWWRHSGIRDLVDVVRGVTLSTLVLLAVLFFTGYLTEIPRTILLLDWGVAVLGFGGARFAVRLLREESRIFRMRGTGRMVPTILVGAGEAADHLLRQLRRSADSDLWPVGLVDDDPEKRGMRLHGVRVLGTTDDLERLVREYGVRLVVIAVPSAPRQVMRRLVERSLATGVEFKIIPSLREVLDGRARVSELRKVQIDDLLGREPVRLDLGALEESIAGRVVLVTGGAGSIGSELARQIAGLGPSRLVLLDQAESALYFLDLALRRKHPDLQIVPVVADVTSEPDVERVFARHRPSHVFHAAAYKHVPLMEENPLEAVRNNVFGTLTVAECASRFHAEAFVLISTDKAVHPSSVMGATKRIAERLVLGWPALRASGTVFRAVRFGNVLGSDGSVIPLFNRQLAAGEPLTVTHRDVTRYFMTIPEAVQLVLQAATLPQAAGRICMLEMGEPVRITELAENLIRLSGLEPYRDVPIVFTGLRPGEKLHEELMTDLEETVPTEVEKIRIVRTGETDGAALQSGLDSLAASLALGLTDDLLRGVCALVPDCVSPLRERGRQRAGASG
jgi:FlaA1/EpsC-like NDP-sugar epimerase